MTMFPLFLTLTSPQVPDVEMFNRLALAELPGTRLPLKATLIDGSTLVTVTYQQYWVRANYDDGPSYNIYAEEGFIDCWKLADRKVTHIASKKLKGFVPGWTRESVKLFSAKNGGGVVVVVEASVVNVPLIEVFKIRSGKALIEQEYSALGALTKARIMDRSVSLEISKATVTTGRTTFRDLTLNVIFPH